MTEPAHAPIPVLVAASCDDVVVKELTSLALDARRAAAAGDVVGQALELAALWGSRLPRPGYGHTARFWSALATLGLVDLTVARTAEPHLDALAILTESGRSAQGLPSGATWGVYAAESPDQLLTASPESDGWVLRGQKPWCSLADRVSHALVTAWVDETTRGLFMVDLRAAGVRPLDPSGAWVGHGLPQIRSSGVEFDGVRAQAVGEPGWYLTRQGFAWGGIGVAAVWYGSAVAVARRVVTHVSRRAPDQVAGLHVGQLDLALTAARAALAQAAISADAVPGSQLPGALLAVRVRSIVAQTVETVIRVADHAMGPAPLAHEAEHARRISDLRLYVRQHHAERDVAELGRLVLGCGPDQVPW